MDSMRYPKEFVKRIKTKFPKWRRIHEALDSGSIFVGTRLDDGFHYFEMTPRDIIAAFDEGCECKVERAARNSIFCRDLYEEWYKLYEEYKKARDI